MSEPDPLPPLREVIARHDLQARRSLGQNFLLDLNLTRKIARLAGPLDAGTVIEVGPGPGGLTRALLAEGAAHVFAVETDPRCRAALEEIATVWPGRLEIRIADALAEPLWEVGTSPRRIVANLPYNVATPLLVRWLAHAAAFESLTLMFQKEVAERLAAPPGGKAYGRLSVLTQWLCEVEMLLDLPGRAFTPPPKVTSSVVQLRPRAAPRAEAEFGTLERVLAAAFGQRRKMLRGSLKSLGTDAAALLATAGIDGERRAESLSVEEFCALARALG